jgi:hypothetical protein
MDLGDGIVFDPKSMRADAIRDDNTYCGTRINFGARIGSARCQPAALASDRSGSNPE